MESIRHSPFATRRSGAALFAINLAALVFGGTALFGKLDVAPIWIVAGRGGFVALTLFGFALLRRVSLRLGRREMGQAGAMGAILALHWVTFFQSVQEAGVAVATLTFAGFPLIVVLLEAALRRRRPAPVELGCGLAILFAIFLLVGRGLPGGGLARHGAVVGLVSAGAFAVFSVGSQRQARRVNAIALSLYQNLAVAVLSMPAFFFALRAPQGSDWAFIALLGMATATMHQLYFFALRHLPSGVCGGFIALEPVYAILFAAVLFGDRVNPITLLSGALIVGASFVLLSRSETPGLNETPL